MSNNRDCSKRDLKVKGRQLFKRLNNRNSSAYGIDGIYFLVKVIDKRNRQLYSETFMVLV